uniref:Uncharacterized protein n=1 Tax=Lygus hesperus TaxID=30085 RepID=A0A146LQD7_LYGHE
MNEAHTMLITCSTLLGVFTKRFVYCTPEMKQNPKYYSLLNFRQVFNHEISTAINSAYNMSERLFGSCLQTLFTNASDDDHDYTYGLPTIQDLHDYSVKCAPQPPSNDEGTTVSNLSGSSDLNDNRNTCTVNSSTLSKVDTSYTVQPLPQHTNIDATTFVHGNCNHYGNDSTIDSSHNTLQQPSMDH